VPVKSVLKVNMESHDNILIMIDSYPAYSIENSN
jgi:hypothetical protein